MTDPRSNVALGIQYRSGILAPDITQAGRLARVNDTGDNFAYDGPTLATLNAALASPALQYTSAADIARASHDLTLATSDVAADPLELTWQHIGATLNALATLMPTAGIREVVTKLKVRDVGTGQHDVVTGIGTLSRIADVYSVSQSQTGDSSLVSVAWTTSLPNANRINAANGVLSFRYMLADGNLRIEAKNHATSARFVSGRVWLGPIDA